MLKKDLKSLSKIDFSVEGDKINTENITLSCFMRISDALEKITNKDSYMQNMISSLEEENKKNRKAINSLRAKLRLINKQ